MQSEVAESVVIDAGQSLTQAELCSLCGLSSSELDELVEYGVLLPVSGEGEERQFNAGSVLALRQASLLCTRFDLDLFTLGLLFSQLERIARLKQQVRTLQVHLGPRA